MPLPIKTYQDFRGGWNTDTAPDNLLDSELTVADNVDLMERGGLSSRSGTAPLMHTATCPSQVGLANTEIKLAATASAVNAYYVGWYVTIVTGTGIGQKRTVNAYVGATRVATITAAWTTVPDATSVYEAVLDYNAQVERLIEWPRTSGVRTLLAVMTDAGPAYNLYAISADGTRTVVQALASLHFGYFWHGDRFYFTDGTEYRYYDGANTHLVQLATPAAGPTIDHTPVASAMLAGTYRCKVVFYNALGVESVASAEGSHAINAGDQIDWTNIPTAGVADCVGRRLYRTENGGSIFKLVTDIPLDVITVYTDTVLNASLGALFVTDNALAPIRRCGQFQWHPDSRRIFASLDATNPIYVYFSEVAQPGYFKSTSYLQPTTADGPVYGLSIFGASTIVFYQSAVQEWDGLDPATAIWKKIPAGEGTVAPYSVVLTPSTLTFLGAAGLFALTPGLLDLNVVLQPDEQLVPNLAENKVCATIRAMTHQATACAVWDKYRERYLLAYGDTGTRNNRVLVLDWSLRAFTRITGLAVNDLCLRSSGDLLFACQNYIVKMGVGAKDWDVVNDTYKAILFSVVTKPWDLGYPQYEKKLNKVYLNGKQAAVYLSHVDVGIESGYLSDLWTDVGLDVSFVWSYPWVMWGATDLLTREFRCRFKGLRFSVRFENDTVGEAVTLYGFAFEYRILHAEGVEV